MDDTEIVTDLDVTDLVLFRPRIPFCKEDALWGGVAHACGQISKHVDVVWGLTELCKGSGTPRPQKPKSSTMKTTRGRGNRALVIVF